MLEENNGPMCGDDHEDLRLIDTDNQLEQQILDIGSLPFSTTQNKILLESDCNQLQHDFQSYLMLQHLKCRLEWAARQFFINFYLSSSS